MSSSQSNKKSKLILWIFVLFFSTFIVVDIIYITIAEKTWRGIVTEDGYQKGLKYNQTIKAAKEQKELGWKLEINYKFVVTKNGLLTVKLLDNNTQIIKDAVLVANIKRPVQEGKDFTVDLKFDATLQTYIANLEFPLIGQWDIEIVARKGEDVYQDMKRLVIR
jgi:nitrogen fixation protein FixH